MTIKRLFQTIGLNMQLGSAARGKFLRKNKIFRSIGQNVRLQLRMIPLYPELIKFHNNIMIASHVSFVTHDAIHLVLNDRAGKKDIMYPEYVGCIEIGNNVFVGSHSTIMYGVKIGDNVIVGSNTLVNKNLAPNSVYAGVPARRICSLEEFLNKRKIGTYSSVNKNQHITPDEIEAAWTAFDNKRKLI